MKAVALLSMKGGVGKSTLAIGFAVIAAESGPSYLIDRDGAQGTTSLWHARRQDGEAPPEEPGLIDLGGQPLSAAVDGLKGQKGTLIIDTRPSATGPEMEAARLADLVVVPVKTGIFDVEAISKTLRMVREIGKEAVIVVNAARHASRAMEARASLSEYPERTCPHYIGDRAVFQDAAMLGLGVGEMTGAAARTADTEIRRVWDWVHEATR